MQELQEERKVYGQVSFKTASEWGGINMVLCNNIPQIDENILYQAENYDEETDSYDEVYQWYITDVSEWVAEWQERVFGIKYIYSEVLDCYIMPVYHFGTSWDYVPCDVYDKDFWEVNKELEFKRN